MPDILTNGIIKEKYILIYHRDLFQYTLGSYMVYRFTTNGNCSACCLVIFCNQIQNGRFAGTGVPDNGRELLVWHCKGGVFQHRLSGYIREVHTVEGDFMGGPFVSYTTVDTATDRVFTLDCYVYSPKLPKRNYMREVEHLLHLVKFPAATGSASATVTAGRREAAKSDAPASRDANPKPEAISSES